MSSRPSSKPESGADQAACTRQALQLLARREHSRLELERKLRAHGFRDAVAAAALDGLASSGALAESRFAESFVRSRAARGQGPVRIRAELAQRGVGAALLDDAQYDWPALARQARRKRFGEALPQGFKERARQARFLEQRGFAAAHIKRALEVDGDSD